MTKQIINGWAQYKEDYYEEECLLISKSKTESSYDENLRYLITNSLHNLGCDDIQNDEDYSNGMDRRFVEKNISMRLFASDKKESLESIQEKVVLDSMGLLDYQVNWYGYSEYTIIGYNIKTFMLGGHNMFDIIKSYEGKYIYLIIDKVESSDCE